MTTFPSTQIEIGSSHLNFSELDPFLVQAAKTTWNSLKRNTQLFKLTTKESFSAGNLSMVSDTDTASFRMYCRLDEYSDFISGSMIPFRGYCFSSSLATASVLRLSATGSSASPCMSGYLALRGESLFLGRPRFF